MRSRIIGQNKEPETAPLPIFRFHIFYKLFCIARDYAINDAKPIGYKKGKK